MSASRVEKQMSLRICVSQVGEHITVGVYMYVFLGGVSLLGEHIIITRDLCFPVSGTHVTRDICFPGRVTHITRYMCFPGRGTHITRDLCFPGWATHITIDMCFPVRGAHITGDMCFPGRGTHNYHWEFVFPC